MRAKLLFRETHDATRSATFIRTMLVAGNHAPAHHKMLVSLPQIFTDQIPTAGTDGYRCYYNWDFFMSLPNDSQRAFLMCHEAAHAMLMHPQRGLVYQKRGYVSAEAGWDHALFNIGGDYIINDDLIALGLEPIPSGMYSDQYGRNDIVDAVYLDLWKAKQEQPEPSNPSDDEEGDSEQSGGPEGQPSGEGDQSGSDSAESGSDGAGGESTPDESGTGEGDADGESGDNGSGSGDDPTEGQEQIASQQGNDGHDYHLTPVYEGSPEEQELAQRSDDAEVREAIDNAIEEGQRRGQGLGKAVEANSHRYRDMELCDIDWRTALAEFFNRSGRDGEQTYTRINMRKFITRGTVSPDRQGVLERVVIVGDVSYSVDSEVLNAFMGHAAQLIEEITVREPTMMLWTNTEVVEDVEVDSGYELLDLDVPWGGGTYLSSAIDWLEDEGVSSDLILVFTDGYLDDSDWEGLARNDILVALDRQPDSEIQRELDRNNINYIVAKAA